MIALDLTRHETPGYSLTPASAPARRLALTETLTAFMLTFDALVGRIEKRLMTWQPKAGETEKL